MTLPDRIYEAAALPELWPDVLQEISDDIAAGGCTLITIDGGPPLWKSSPAIRPLVQLYFESGWGGRNDRIARSNERGLTGLMRDIDLFAREEIEAMPLVSDFLKPNGFGWGAGINLPMPSGEMLLFSVEQRWADGPVSDRAMERLGQLWPHLGRAALLTAKLRFERARAAVEAFGLTDIPAALIRADGRVVAANRLFESFGAQISLGSRGRLLLSDPRPAGIFAAALDRLAAGDADAAPLSIAVPGRDEAPPLVLHLLPAKGQSRDLFGSATALVLLSRVTARDVAPAGLLQALFDLTTAESRVARAILAGGDSARIGAELRISPETVRTHTKAILAKTGMERRIDFVRMMSGARP